MTQIKGLTAVMSQLSLAECVVALGTNILARFGRHREEDHAALGTILDPQTHHLLSLCSVRRMASIGQVRVKNDWSLGQTFKCYFRIVPSLSVNYGRTCTF